MASSIRKELDGDGDMAVVDDGYAAMFIKPARMIELRDLLLREFPMATPASKSLSEYEQECRKERRERIATAALAGVLTQTRRDPGIAASEAVEQADDLIRELDKEQP